ncbi:hypothetical protein [Aeromonas sp. 603696]|uniref:hypothetical protein n=1 Tax=Aeromonas sp. 603696 TaxID=2712049 RepID=UPI003BA0FDC9
MPSLCEQTTEISKLISENRIDDLWFYILIIFISGVSAYLGSRIKKSAELTAINKNFSEHLVQQRKLTEDLTKIRTDFEKENIAYQIKQTDFNVRSLEAIELVFSKLVVIKKCAKAISNGLHEEKAEELHKAVDDFIDTFDVKQIWIPKKLSDEIKDVAIELGNKTHIFIQLQRRTTNMSMLSDSQVEKLFEKQDAFYDYMDEKIKNIFDDLSNKIRTESTN